MATTNNVREIIEAAAPGKGSALRFLPNKKHTLYMSKEEILKGWQHGDDAEVARLMKEKYDITIARCSLSRWRRKTPNVSPLSEKYLAAYLAIQQNRK